jgi:hypothetical protein
MPNGQICLSESIAEFDLTRARVRVRANEARLAADERVTEGRTPAEHLAQQSKAVATNRKNDCYRSRIRSSTRLAGFKNHLAAKERAS